MSVERGNIRTHCMAYWFGRVGEFFRTRLHRGWHSCGAKQFPYVPMFPISGNQLQPNGVRIYTYVHPRVAQVPEVDALEVIGNP